MGIDDKANNAVTNHLGAAKEGAGKLTGNEQLEREGQQDQAKAQLQDAGEKIKDAAADVGGNLREAARKIKEGFSKN
ncbi:CsbD family protein [Arthrobacter sp. 1P04PC]|uniref:CsbD family protein n=1 Tax=Micrococcaceae TaxID=1268 RepID=UPI0025B5CD1A|nr:CsbD family protein [Arthrobacter sp. YD4]MDN3935325.1 CsbD family protein [Arthrobacter sp. YD4]